MWIIIALFAAGILLGRLISSKSKSTKWVDTLLFWVVVVFLLVLGLQAGSNKTVIQNLDSLGLQAFVISVLALLGSVILVRFVIYPFIKVRK